MTSLLGEKVCFFCHCSSLFDICRTRLELKAWSPYVKDAPVDSRGGLWNFEKTIFLPSKIWLPLLRFIKNFQIKIFSPHINSIAPLPPPPPPPWESTGVSLIYKNHKHIFENRFLTFPNMPCSSHGCTSNEIFAIDMLTALKPSSEHDSKYIVQLLRLYGDCNKNKVANKTSPEFPLFMFAYSYRLFKKFNRASLKLFPGSTFSSPRWWIHTCSFRNCLESINN